MWFCVTNGFRFLLSVKTHAPLNFGVDRANRSAGIAGGEFLYRLIRSVEIEVTRENVVVVVRARFPLMAETKVQGQAPADLPVVVDERSDKGHAHRLERIASRRRSVVDHAQQKRRMRVAGHRRVGRQIGAGRRVRVEIEIHQIRKNSDPDVVAVFGPELQVVRTARLGHLAAERIVMRVLVPVAALTVARLRSGR